MKVSGDAFSLFILIVSLCLCVSVSLWRFITLLRRPLRAA
jgi:hypothetical protein